MIERLIHVLRGGSWGSFPFSLRASYRSGDGPGNRYDSYGFRLVVRIEDEVQGIPDDLFEKFRLEAQQHSKELLRRLAKGVAE